MGSDSRLTELRLFHAKSWDIVCRMYRVTLVVADLGCVDFDSDAVLLAAFFSL